MNQLKANTVKSEFEIITSKSSGPGGQHVNKVETKVTIKFNIEKSEILSDLQKEILRAAHKNKVTKDGVLIVTSEAKRSQLKNKEIAFKKIDRLFAKAFSKRKPRKPTQPTTVSKKKRLDAKKIHSEKKKLRQRLL